MALSASSPSTSSLLDRIQNLPRLPPSQRTEALRSLKHQVVGHVPQKEAWVKQGALEPIVSVLRAPSSQQQRSSGIDASSWSPGLGMGMGFGATTVTGNKTRVNGKDPMGNKSNKVGGGGGIHAPVTKALTEEETARLQALQLLAAFANGGPAFLPPLHAAGALPAILGYISPTTNPQPIVLAALRAINDFADSAALALPACAITPTILANDLFAWPYRTYLDQVLSSWMAASSYATCDQLNTVTALISKLCRREEHRLALADEGVLDRLAAMVASFAVAQGHAVRDATRTGVLPPAPRGLRFGLVMDAVAAIIADSKYRTCKFMWSPAILATWPPSKAPPPGELREQWSALERNKLFYSHHQRGPIDYLLPAIPNLHTRSHTLSLAKSLHAIREAFRELNSDLHLDSRYESGNGFGAGEQPDLEDTESQVVPWLVYQVRTQQSEYDKLAAAHVLASVFKVSPRKAFRESSMGSLLVVPLLIDILHGYDIVSVMTSPSPLSATNQLAWAVLERAPATLAMLVTDCEPLQKAAHDCRAIKLLSLIFKKTHVTTYKATRSTYWSPRAHVEKLALPGPCSLGDDGQFHINMHIARVREATLRAIAALAASKDDYRKEFHLEGIMPYVVESLAQGQHPGKLQLKRDAGNDGVGRRTSGPAATLGKKASGDEAIHNAFGKETNPVAVIVAACHVVRTMAWSINILRTAIPDYGVALPVFYLLSHEDVDVQIAATAVMCNLVLRISPAKETLVDMDVLKLLCQHARSRNTQLSLNALWALKHLVDDVDLDVKKACLMQLKPDWLIRTIRGDTEDDGLVPQSAAASAKSRLGIGSLISDDVDADDDVDMGGDDSTRPSAHGRDPRTAQRLGARLETLRDSESDPVRKARSDELVIQEQCIHLIRNLMCLPNGSSFGNDSADIVDLFFNAIGPERLFGTLMAKLQPSSSAINLSTSPNSTSRKPLGFFGSSRLSASSSSSVFPHPKIIDSVIYVLVHIAASAPRHRATLAQQSRLLSLVSQQAVHCVDRDVRAGVCYLVCNLASEDTGDEAGRAQRIRELRNLGFVPRIERLLQEDTDLDVKQRANEALYHLKTTTY